MQGENTDVGNLDSKMLPLKESSSFVLNCYLVVENQNQKQHQKNFDNH